MTIVNSYVSFPEGSSTHFPNCTPRGAEDGLALTLQLAFQYRREQILPLRLAAVVYLNLRLFSGINGVK